MAEPVQPGAITFLWVPGSRRKGDEGGKWDRRGELIGFRVKKKKTLKVLWQEEHECT